MALLTKPTYSQTQAISMKSLGELIASQRFAGIRPTKTAAQVSVTSQGATTGDGPGSNGLSQGRHKIKNNAIFIERCRARTSARDVQTDRSTGSNYLIGHGIAANRLSLSQRTRILAHTHLGEVLQPICNQ